MIDIHCHILPGVDDGAADEQVALEMARIAQRDGITVIFATPHCLDGSFNVTRDQIMAGISKLNALLQREHLNVQVLAGADVYVQRPDLDDLIVQRKVVTLNDAGKYVLLELARGILPDAPVPPVCPLVARLLNKGITPIISHPERHGDIRRHPQKLIDLVDAGALAQITAGSLTGGFGRGAQKCAQRLLRQHLVHFIATDAHGIGPRQPRLSPACRIAARLVGQDKARRLVLDNPQAIIENRPLLNAT